MLHPSTIPRPIYSVDTVRPIALVTPLRGQILFRMATEQVIDLAMSRFESCHKQQARSKDLGQNFYVDQGIECHSLHFGPYFLPTHMSMSTIFVSAFSDDTSSTTRRNFFNGVNFTRFLFLCGCWSDERFRLILLLLCKQIQLEDIMGRWTLLSRTVCRE